MNVLETKPQIVSKVERFNFFTNTNGKLQEVTVADGSLNGLWQAIQPFDMDADGDLDLFVMNHSLFNYGKTIQEWEQKIEKMATETIEHNVTNILGVPSWTLLLLRRVLQITGKRNIMEVWRQRWRHIASVLLLKLICNEVNKLPFN